MITRPPAVGGLWCASAMCGHLLQGTAAAAGSKGMCVQYLVLKGWKEKQNPAHVRAADSL